MTTQPITNPPPMNGSIDVKDNSSPGAGMAKRAMTIKPIRVNNVKRMVFERLTTPKKNTAATMIKNVGLSEYLLQGKILNRVHQIGGFKGA